MPHRRTQKSALLILLASLNPVKINYHKTVPSSVTDRKFGAHQYHINILCSPSYLHFPASFVVMF
jgi:hypothetical protein